MSWAGNCVGRPAAASTPASEPSDPHLPRPHEHPPYTRLETFELEHLPLEALIERYKQDRPALDTLYYEFQAAVAEMETEDFYFETH